MTKVKGSAGALKVTKPLDPGPTPGARTILIIDDEPSIGHMLVELFDDPRYKVILATDGQAALAQASLARPGLCFVDLNLGSSQITGIELIRALKTLIPEVVIIMLSGMSQAQALDALGQGYVDEFVNKPFSPLYLVLLVEQYLTKNKRVVDLKEKPALFPGKNK